MSEDSRWRYRWCEAAEQGAQSRRSRINSAAFAVAQTAVLAVCGPFGASNAADPDEVSRGPRYPERARYASNTEFAQM